MHTPFIHSFGYDAGVCRGAWLSVGCRRGSGAAQPGESDPAVGDERDEEKRRDKY